MSGGMRGRSVVQWLAVAWMSMAFGLAQAQSLPPCTATNFVAQEQQSNCLVANPTGNTVITYSYTNDPTFVNTPLSQTVNQYRTTLTALLNGGTTVFQQTFAVAFSDPPVQNAIAQADAVLTSDGATFGSPVLTLNSTTLQSSVVSYVATSPTPNLPTLIGCFIASGAAGTCAGVTVRNNNSNTETFGPATVMIGPNYSDQFVVFGGQLDINVDQDFTYTVTQNAVTTNTYLTTQTYVIQGTGGVAYSPCDINRDGKTNVADVQGMVNESLGGTSAANDLNRDGVVNVVDVQIVLNGVLNLGCTAGTPGRPVATPQSVIVRPERPVGAIFTVAGNGSPGYVGDGGPATSAEIMNPAGVAVDRAGNLYIADARNYRIRKVAVSGEISTVAGNGDPSYLDPAGIAVDATGDLYIADSSNHRIRKLSANGTLSTVVGDEANLNHPSAVAVDSAGNLYIADTYNQRIRKVAVDGTISLVAGNGNAGYSGDGGPATNASLYDPNGVAVDAAGALYIADSANHRIRKMAVNGTISTVAGNGDRGYLHPAGVAVDVAGNLYIADARNNRIRRVAVNGTISTLAGEGAGNVRLYGPSSVALDAAGNLFMSDTYNQLILEMTGQGR